MARRSYQPLREDKGRAEYPLLRVWTSEANQSVQEQRLGIHPRSHSIGRASLFGELPLRSNQRANQNQPTSNGIQPKRVATKVINKKAAPQGRPGLYERGLEHQARREANLAKLRKEMMQQCTFTPKTSQSNTIATTTTKGSSGPKSMADDVYERLYRHAGSVSTPQKERARTSLPTLHTTPNSNVSKSGSACSSRIEELYQDGKLKLRRRMTEEQERALRDRRREQQEILECTFRPKTKWASRAHDTRYPDARGRIGISPRVLYAKSPPLAKKDSKNLPHEILVTSPSDIRHLTPPRNRTDTADHSLVSPLNDPSVSEDTSVIDSILLPRMQYISTVTVGTSTAASCSQRTSETSTEYGSI